MNPDYEIDFRRLRDDLQALAERFDREDLRDELDRYDIRKTKALAACYELWDYVAGQIVYEDGEDDG